MNIVKFLLCTSFMVISLVGYGQKIVGVQTWINDEFDEAVVYSVSGDEISSSIDLSARNPGLYVLHCRPIDNNGTYGTVKSRYIYHIDPSHFKNRNPKECHVWVDDDVSTCRAYPIVDGAVNVDFSTGEKLSVGLHFIHVRICYESGEVSAPLSRLLYVRGDGVSEVKWFRYWWNDSYDGYVEKVAELDPETNTYMLNSELRVPDNLPSDAKSVTLNVLYGCDDGRIGEIFSSEIRINGQFVGLESVTASSSKWDATWRSGCLSIVGLTPGKGYVYIYTLSGKLIKAIPVEESSVTTDIRNEKMLIICYDNKAKKLLNQNG